MSFTIMLSSYPKRAASTARPSGGESYECVLKDRCSKYSPTFYLYTDDDLLTRGFNYCIWGSMYYYIEDIVSRGNAQYDIICRLDPFATCADEIKSTTCFVVRAESSFNPMLIDEYCPSAVSHTCSFTSVNAGAFAGYASSISSFSYIFRFLSSSSGTDGIIATYNVSAAQMANLSSMIFTAEAGTDVKEYFTGVNSALVSLRIIPMAYGALGGPIEPMVIGAFDTGLGAHAVNIVTKSYSFNLVIPWEYRDFRMERNITPVVFLPYVGTVTLSVNELIGSESLLVNVEVDPVGGSIQYTLLSDRYNNVIGIYNAVYGASVPLAALTTNAGGSVSGIVGAATKSILGKLGGAASSLLSIGTSVFSTSGSVIGTQDGRIQLQCSRPEIALYMYNSDSANSPAGIASAVGRPLMDVRRLGALSGYVQTRGASVTAAMPQSIVSTINSALDGGMWIE